MKNHFTLILLFLFCLWLKPASAQDLIIKKDGSKVYCSIVRIDSVSIHYFKSPQKNIAIIRRAEVETFYTKTAGKNGYTKPDTVKKKDELIIVHLCAGLANPTGRFAEKNMEEENAGLANRGFLLQGTIILKVASNFGFCANYSYQKYPVANSIIQQAYAYSLPPNVSVSVKSTDWISQGFFGGMYLNAPVKTVKNLFLGFTVLGGLPKFKSPELAISMSQPGVNLDILQRVGETNAAAGIGKIALQYRIEEIALNFGVSYFIAKPSFSNVLIKDNRGGYGYAKFDQKITSVNVELGLSFLILK